MCIFTLILFAKSVLSNFYYCIIISLIRPADVWCEIDDCCYQKGQRLKAKSAPVPRVKYIAPPPRKIKADEEEDSDDGGSQGRVGYKMRVKTGRRSGAGTTANVRILELIYSSSLY